MRKKSHISLARYLVGLLEDEELKKYRFFFYIGSILPDIKPSFVYRRHEISGTYPAVKEKIRHLSGNDRLRGSIRKGTKYYMDLGQVSHYLADYFTFPHNEVYSGTLKEHCSYEEKLKKDLRKYIQGGEAEKQELQELSFDDAEKLCDYIEAIHKEYIGQNHNVEGDIEHIVMINRQAVKGMIKLMEKQSQKEQLRENRKNIEKSNKQADIAIKLK